MSMLNTILHKVLVFLRIRKKGTGDDTCTPFREIRPFWDFQIFNIEDHNRSSTLVDLYYVFYRFFRYSPWGNPRQGYREVKWFIQRGRRGYADCDVWSLYSYLDSWLPAALRRLKETKQGVPGIIFDGLPMNDKGYHDEAEFKIAEARWDAIMDKMIVGFEAHRRSSDGIYEEELGQYPLDRPSGLSASAWKKVKDDRHAATRLLEERDQKLVEEGMTLFVKYYRNLWD